MGRLLAIDYGSKRVGLAVTDPMKMFATALTTVHSKDLIAYLKAYHQKEGIEAFVLGEPRTVRNLPSETARQIDEFAVHLRRTFPEIAVHRVDERFTSRIALQAISQSTLKKKQRQDKELVDQISAVLILQTYLEQQS
ncbi:MAG: Holliday junction resolvase RuvX [Bacteroidia bacterium]